MIGAEIALAAGFVLLAARRPRAAVLAYAAQSAAVAAVAGWQAVAQRSAMLGGVAALVLAVGAVAVPAMLRRAERVRRRAARWPRGMAGGGAGAGRSRRRGGRGRGHGLAVSVTLAGLLAIAEAGGERSVQTTGLGAAANGAILAALLLPAGPMPALFAVASLALPVAAARA